MKIILLAAGLSKRLGTGEQKILKEYNGDILVLKSFKVCIELFDTVVVTGYKSDDVEYCLSNYSENSFCSHNYIIIYNPDYKSGQLSSCIKGLELVDDDFMFVLSDTPNIDCNLLKTGCSEFAKMPEEKNILRLFAGGVPIHPVIFRKSVKEILLEDYAKYFKKNYNLRDIIKLDGRIHEHKVNLCDAKYSKDVDYPDDFN